jgi:hypothetical protein
MYSKFDDIQHNGASFCVTALPNPLPKLTPDRHQLWPV